MINVYYKPSQGRLHEQNYGWAPSASNNQQWFQVDFGGWTKVTRVAIQGRPNAAWWVKTFQLAYSYDGVFYTSYKEEGEAKVTLHCQC